MMWYGAASLIRNTRFFKGLTNADIARALNVSAAYISDVEHGRRKLTKARTPDVERLLELPTGTLDLMYGQLPKRVADIVANDPYAAKSLANAINEWRMVNHS